MIGDIVEDHDCGSSLEGQSLESVLKGEGMNHYLQVFFFWPVRVKNVWTRQVRRGRRKAEVGGDSGETRGWDRPGLTNVSICFYLAQFNSYGYIFLTLGLF